MSLLGYIARESYSFDWGHFTPSGHEIDLQEFDYIGTVARDIVMFKHVVTKRYLNLAERNGRIVWCEYDSKSGVVERDVDDEGFRHARSSSRHMLGQQGAVQHSAPKRQRNEHDRRGVRAPETDAKNGPSMFFKNIKTQGSP